MKIREADALLKSSRFAMLVAPILSMCILAFGNTFYTTFTTVELNHMGESNWIVGIVSAAFFAGMMLGSLFSQKLILRLGYIRAYIFFAALMSMVSLLQGIIIEPISWGVLRLLCGYALAGLFIVIESWCLDSVTADYKGRILSIYLFCYYFVQASGQFMLNIDFATTLMAFAVISLFATFSIIPVSLTRFEMPKKEGIELLSPFKLAKKAPLSIWAAMVGGFTIGCIYAIYPLFLKQLDYKANGISYMMFSTILGGMILQLPIGRLSDKYDRRRVLLVITVISVMICALIMMLHDFWSLGILSFILGGLTFTIYPLSIAHASDYVDNSQITGVIGVLTISYGIGSMLGPIGITWFMSMFGPFGFFVFMGFVCLLFTIYILWRLNVRPKALPQEEKVSFTSMAPEAAIAG
ncbi:MAG: MFS transporter, partial [Francisellaceae bacterium]